MYRLNKKTISTIENRLGVDIDTLEDMDVEDISTTIESKTHKRLTFLKSTDSRLMGRGSVFLYLNRFLDTKKIDKKLKRI